MKTRRTPEVPWTMAFPMFSLSIVTLLTYSVPLKWNLWLSPNVPLTDNSTIIQWAIPLIITSGLLGFIIGGLIPLRRAWAISNNLYLRFFQDLFAYDFYMEKVYKYTVVWAVVTLSKVMSWIDRYIIDGFVNLVSLAAIFSGNALKYNASGQSQFYVLTIVFGVTFLLWFILSGQWSILFDYWLNFFS